MEVTVDILQRSQRLQLPRGRETRGLYGALSVIMFQNLEK